ncbi:MAG: AraC family transcriptional regulator [Ignavibacteria bacterium GWB2_36_8]|nr:MAG: AraC family transcriptional regulator [Ignavibacteria bacterium GWB2_36_8]OGU49041.1 MAG: AraC family transcriptional regulator [Ignavibacteria bacterium GWC2_36_12]
MKPKILHIKNMVCDRCIKVVREELEKLGYKTDNVILGEARISSEKKQFDLNGIRKTLEENGFELINDKQAKLIEEIKISLIDLIHYKSANELEKISLSKFLSEKFHHSYQHISSLFSSKEGITIEKYFINQKIEKAKELLVYNELTLSEISYKLGYSSVQHLSNQFKKVTGFTPSEFKKLRVKKRLPLDKVK